MQFKEDWVSGNSICQLEAKNWWWKFFESILIVQTQMDVFLMAKGDDTPVSLYDFWAQLENSLTCCDCCTPAPYRPRTLFDWLMGPRVGRNIKLLGSRNVRIRLSLDLMTPFNESRKATRVATHPLFVHTGVTGQFITYVVSIVYEIEPVNCTNCCCSMITTVFRLNFPEVTRLQLL